MFATKCQSSQKEELQKHLQWRELVHKVASSSEIAFLSKEDLRRERILICMTWYKNHWKMGPVSAASRIVSGFLCRCCNLKQSSSLLAATSVPNVGPELGL